MTSRVIISAGYAKVPNGWKKLRPEMDLFRFVRRSEFCCLLRQCLLVLATKLNALPLISGDAQLYRVNVIEGNHVVIGLEIA